MSTFSEESSLNSDLEHVIRILYFIQGEIAFTAELLSPKFYTVRNKIKIESYLQNSAVQTNSVKSEIYRTVALFNRGLFTR